MVQKIKDFLGNKNNLLILILTGILLMVIAIPVEKKGKSEEKSMALAGFKKDDMTGKEFTYGETNGSVTDRMTYLQPDSKEEDEADHTFLSREELEEELSQLLSGVEGAGKVKVMILFAESEELVADGENVGGQKTPFIKKTKAPKVEGAVIICSGAKDAYVNKNLTEATMVLLGLDAYKVKVIKGNGS